MVNTPQDKAFVVRTEQRDLCDPGTFLPVKVYYGYAENDTLLTLTANNADGTAYTGDISLLVTCGAGGGGGGTNVNASQAGSWTVNVVQPVTVDGTVGISGTVPVTGAVSASQSGTWNINNVSGTVSLPTGAATAANQLPDGHNVTVDNGPGAAAVNIQDGGNSITVDGTFSQPPNTTASGTITALAQTVAINLTTESSATLELSGTYSTVGGVFEAQIGGSSNWISIYGWNDAFALWSTSYPSSTNVTRSYRFNTIGVTSIRFRCSAYGSGTLNVLWVGSFCGSTNVAAAITGTVNTNVTGTPYIEAVGNGAPPYGVQLGGYDQDTADFQYVEVTGNALKTADIRTGSSAQQIQGAVAAGAPVAGSQPVTIAFQDIFGNAAIPTGINAGGLNVLGVVPVDLALNIQTFRATGEAYALVAATGNSVATARYIACDSAGNIGTSSAGLALRLDEGATYTYIGEAQPGTSDAAASWRIKRMTNADSTIVWADGNASFDNIWNNRAALAYS